MIRRQGLNQNRLTGTIRWGILGERTLKAGRKWIRTAQAFVPYLSTTKGQQWFRRNEDTFRSKQWLIGRPLKKPLTIPNGNNIASFVNNVVEGLFGGRQLAAA